MMIWYEMSQNGFMDQIYFLPFWTKCVNFSHEHIFHNSGIWQKMIILVISLSFKLQQSTILTHTHAFTTYALGFDYIQLLNVMYCNYAVVLIVKIDQTKLLSFTMWAPKTLSCSIGPIITAKVMQITFVSYLSDLFSIKPKIPWMVPTMK